MKNVIRSFLAALVLLLPLIGLADSWSPPAPITATSNNGLYRITVYPASLAGVESERTEHEREQCEAVLEKLGPEAYEFVWRKQLINSISPVAVLVANDARFVTFDNWGKLGYGDDALVLYRADGTAVKQMSVVDLVGEEVTRKFSRSATSMQWRRGDSYINDRESALHLRISWPPEGRSLNASWVRETIVLELDTGEIVRGLR